MPGLIDRCGEPDHLRPSSSEDHADLPSPLPSVSPCAAVVSGVAVGVPLALVVLFLLGGYRDYLLPWASLVALAPGSILARMSLSVIAYFWLPWSAHVYTETGGFAWSAIFLSFLF